jgi:hypothetical protein
MRIFVCLFTLVCVACHTNPEPSAKFQEAVIEALAQGFQLANQRGKVAGVEIKDPQTHWILHEFTEVPLAKETFRLELSNKQYSDVVDIEEWVFSSPEDAQQIVVASGAQMTKLKEFKMLYKIWREEERVYFVSTRAFMFEGEWKKMLALLEYQEKL